jgi:sugar transferase (PEP-CTERM/EpsH1 system associated)
VKIFYLAHRLPYPPNKGEKIRAFNQIRQLAKKHMVHLCALADDQSDLVQESGLERYCASVKVVFRNPAPTMGQALAAFLRNQSLSVRLFYRKAMAEVVQEKLATERFDCIIVSCSSMAQYVPFCSAGPKIVDFIDVDSEKWSSYAERRSFPFSSVYRREANLLGQYEERVARAFDHSILSSEAEAQLLRRRAKDRPVSVISNGVDLDYFSLSAIETPTIDEPVIVFTGVMDYFPNVDAVRFFCEDIFPLVRESMPEAQFHIVGRNPSRPVKKLEQQPNVSVTGTVPDVRPYLARARVAVAPFRLARGVQNKILEAMAIGLPIVGTSETFKGIAATEADGIRIADDPASFARHIISFLRTDDDSRRSFAAQARSYVERHHRWEDQGARLEQLLEEVVWKHRRKENTVHRTDAEIAEEFAS